MSYKGRCHCGKITYEVEGTIDQVIECNCSHCVRKGFLLWFVPRASLKLAATPSKLPVYLFNSKTIEHTFCDVCGCQPFGLGTDPKSGDKMVAVNVRCLENIDLKALKVIPVDGKNF